jgi:hypothetical protein
MSSTDCHSSPSGIIVSPDCCQSSTSLRLGDVLPDPGQLIPVQVTASPFESTILRPSVLKGPYGHPEVEVFSARRGRNVMSRGCGAKAAALAEVTATAAAQAIDLIVNATIMYEPKACWIEESKSQHQHSASAVNIYISFVSFSHFINGHRLHMVRGCGPPRCRRSRVSPFFSRQNLIFVPSGR